MFRNLSTRLIHQLRVTSLAVPVRFVRTGKHVQQKRIPQLVVPAEPPAARDDSGMQLYHLLTRAIVPPSGSLKDELLTAPSSLKDVRIVALMTI